MASRRVLLREKRARQKGVHHLTGLAKNAEAFRPPPLLDTDLASQPRKSDQEHRPKDAQTRWSRDERVKLTNLLGGALQLCRATIFDFARRVIQRLAHIPNDASYGGEV